MERNSHIVVIFGEGICCSSVPGCFGVCHAFSTCILGCVRHSQTSLPMLSLAPKFVPPCCRSASSWTGDGRLGEPCSYRQLREGTGSERCHIPFWGTYEPCLFFHRKTTRAFHLTQLRVCKTSEVVAADCLILWGQCYFQALMRRAMVAASEGVVQRVMGRLTQVSARSVVMG